MTYNREHIANRRTTFWIVVVATMVFGCKAGQNYNRPDLELPPAFRNISADTTGASDNVAALNWREFFVDSTLISLIDTALKSNLGLQRVSKSVEIAEQNLRRSRADFFPNIAMVLEHDRELYSQNWDSGPNSLYYEDRTPPDQWFMNSLENNASVVAGWEPDLWGKFRRQKEMGEAAFLRSEEFQKAVQTALISDIASSYFNLIMLNAQLKVAQSNLRLNDSTLRIVQLQYRAGQATSLAVSQTESQKLAAASLIPQIEKDIVVKRNNLSQLLGKYPGDEHFLDRGLSDVNFLKNVSAGVPLELLKNRPDITASELALVEANARVGIAQAMRYPSLVLGAELGLGSMDAATLISPNSLFGAFFGSLTLPIFQNRRLKANYIIALRERDIAELEFRENVINAVTEVSNVLVTIQKLEEEYRIAEARLVNSRKAVRESDLLFKTGFATYLEVITAQRNALETELSLVDVRMNLLISNVRLYRALGGGWR